MRTTIMTRKGQVTIPTEIRKALGLVEGDRLEVQLESDTVCLRRAESVITRTAGIFEHPGPGRSAEELREAVETAIGLEAEARSRP
jgi:AbrB family looped-hinge helix DNA binding protein